MWETENWSCNAQTAVIVKGVLCLAVSAVLLSDVSIVVITTVNQQ
jgi:hypothetical protein